MFDYLATLLLRSNFGSLVRSNPRPGGHELALRGPLENGEYDDSEAAQRLGFRLVDFYFRCDDSDGEYSGEYNSAALGELPRERIVVSGLWGILRDDACREIEELRSAGYLQRVTHIDRAWLESDFGLTQLSNLSSITKLEIQHGESLTDEGLGSALRQLSSIDSLTVNVGNMTSDAFSVTPSLQRLETVDVSDTALTDRGLVEYLCKITSLKSLDVSRTFVSASGITTAQVLRPDINLVHDVK